MKPHLYLFTLENIKNVTQTNGIYFFYNNEKKIIYIGKSVNLKDRLSSYKDPNIIGKTKSLVKNTKYFTHIFLRNETEALIHEALMIKKYKPKYNILLKDDKSYLYVKIRKGIYPVIEIARKKDISSNDTYYGPFPTSKHVRRILKVLRRVFPFSTHRLGKIPCFQSQIGLCTPCPNYIENLINTVEKKKLKKIYLGNISNIKKVFEGKVEIVKKEILKNIKVKSSNQEYEKAIKLRDNLEALDYISRRSKVEPDLDVDVNLFSDRRIRELKELRTDLNLYLNINRLKRIECFDIAHISGSYTTGSMVVFINGMADKSLYRQFKIRHTKKSNDYASILEVAQRRNRHLLDWGMPDLILVDGGKGQLKQFQKGFGSSVSIISFAKLSQKLIIPGSVGYNEIAVSKKIYVNLIHNLIDEAHRFSRRYHHKLISKSIYN